jgi:hypothetical protein
VLLFLLSEESVAVPRDDADGLAFKLRPVPGALGARAKIDRAVRAKASAVSLTRIERAALLDALNAWMDSGGFKALGPDLATLRGALEFDLTASPSPTLGA